MYRGPDVSRYTPDPTIPYAIGTVYDSIVPKKDFLLRSELMTITSLLKAQFNGREAWPQHRVFPIRILVLS